jgi:hypothetical protein
MKAQKKLAIGLVVAIIAILIVSQSATHSTEKMKNDRSKTKRNEDVEKAKLKAIRDLSSGSENIR